MKNELSNFDSCLRRLITYLAGVFRRFGSFISSYIAVGIVNGYALHSPGVRFPAGIRDILVSKTSLPAVAPTHTSSRWVPGALSAAVKQPGS
jgi:hypothetical protein